MQKDNKKFTLEEMLSIKRAEKPSVADWDNFDAQLRSKMLKSLVDEKPKHRLFFSPWTFAKLAAVAVPAFCVVITFLARPNATETMSMQKSIELVQIPDIKTSYHSDSYFSANTAGTEYSQNMIQSMDDSNVVYATSDILAYKGMSF